MEKLIYTVSSERGLLEAIFEELEYAEKFVANYGNENWKIESEEMC